ncbi:uncharacterized protein LOC127073752 [Lathyrus oleraceus]|uniref:Uncharacterized protein n=1 Tax=Pisum sativum TaxID=3888 RepID=A0A9D5APH9_PEA|nr:uncharacterized protein LOC127073752 [Pisum sativum]XP_050870922.1 uncharacterized protein LOC127073752 [Pisum sativum]XP_050870923.1 uncharacterized protein LOC127073752 [Pisum sativum]XP_050870924.1 uncharacterized protein LOC127073752 [Pisum sativum]XP_050870926.1 uncharacterized protein LOC127073752 [Pisum sativum]XP_050870927.1 uncharacterized protein LOC127073752 [Pisum sativum]XP_050870928.1 uncharacterized protein LOC127073752 [Pisum sativum]XP_050870929.1 uncharacterized protein 
MALLGANVQCNDKFPRYYSTRELIFDSEGSTWTSSNVNNELRTEFCHMGPFPLSSPSTLLGYNQELVKQTILKHEAIFKDQIRELHRVYQKQRELMDEIKRSELHKQNVRLEASWSSSALSSKNAENKLCTPNLPWSASQSSVLFAESIRLPLVFAQEKNRHIFPAHASTVTEESLKDYKLPESKCKKIGKKLLDLQLPADEYIDSDEGEENVPFKLDLNVPCRLEVEPAAMSNDVEGPAHHTNNCLYDLSMRTKFGSQNLRGDVINKRQDLEGCSHNQLLENEKKCEWKSSGLIGGLFDSFAKGINTEKQPVSVDSFGKNMEQFDDLSCFHSSHQINRGPWTKRKFCSSVSSAQTQCPTSNGLIEALGLPCLEESKTSTHIESVVLNPYDTGVIQGFRSREIGESNLGTEKALAFHSNGKPRMSTDPHCFHDFATEFFQNQSKNQRIEEIEKGCISVVKSPCVDVPNSGEPIPSGEHLMKNEKKHEFLAGIIDLNSSMIEDENMPIDVDFHAPASPENKECSPPRGESDENQLVTSFQFAKQEDHHVQEEQTRIAAEALVSISGFVAQKDIQMTTCSSSESFKNSPLNWFAAIVSTTVDHLENDNETDFNDKVNGLKEFLSDEMDYFEFMTLNLTDKKDLDCCCMNIDQTEQIGGSTLPTQQRKSVRTNRGRWRKDFQSEILPSIASLSRYEVTEDLMTIGSLVSAGTHSETCSQRNAHHNVPSRGRRRSCTSTSNTKDTYFLLNLKQLSSITKLGTEKKGLISWGKTCKKRRAKRFRITKPWFI